MNKSPALITIFLVAVTVSSLAFSPFTLDLTLTARFTALSACLLIAGVAFFRSGGNFRMRVDLILLAYIAYALFSALSLLWAKNKSEAIFDASKVLLSLFSFGFAFFCLRQDAGYVMRRLQKISVVLCFIALLAGFRQYSAVQQPAEGFLYAITGLNGHKNLFSSFLFLNLYFLVTGVIRLEKSWKPWAVAALVLNLVALCLLKTKAVWVGLVLVGCVSCVFYALPLLKQKFRPRLLINLLVILLGANLFFLAGLQPLIKKGLAYNEQVKALAPGKPGLDQERLTIWDKTYYLAKQHPLLGVGIGNWQVFFPDATLTGLWRAEDLNYTFQRPHNDFLWILSETGVIGLNLFLIFLVTLLLFAAKIAERVSFRDFLTGPGLAAAFVAGYFCISFFDFPKERTEHVVWIQVILAILYYYIREKHTMKTIFGLRVSKAGVAAACVLLGFITWVGLLRHQGEYYTRKMLEHKGQFADVLRSGNSAVSFAYTLDPTSVPICWYTGNAYASLGNYPQAHANFLEAYRLNPYNRNVLNDLASSYASLNVMDAAKKLYLEAARISPRFDEPKLNLVAIYINEKNYRLASDCLKTLFHDSERRSEYQRIVDAFL